MNLTSLKALLAVAVAALTLAGCSDDDGSPGSSPGRPASSSDGGGAADGATLARVPEVYRELEPSVVAILVEGVRGEGEGSGVVVRDNVIVTNSHVVAGARDVAVALASGERLPARVVGRDELTDLAVLRVRREDLPPARFADGLPRVGSLAVAMGNPLGFENSVTAGVVSGVDRSIPSGGRTPALVGLIQTDAAISPGNSGGALVGADGRVIGINVAYIPPQARAVSIGFAIPAPTVVEVVEELLDDGEVEHSYLGLRLRPLTDQIAGELGLDVDRGALVAAVEDPGPAQEAGVRPGDVIVRVGDRRVEAVEDVLSALRGREPGERVTLEVLRDGERRRLTTEIASRPR